MYLYFIEPDLHGRHGGLKAGAGDPHGPGVLQMLLVPLLTNFPENNVCVGFCIAFYDTATCLSRYAFQP